MRFSQAFRSILSARGYTQQGIADEVGVRQAAVASMLQKGNPSVDAMDRYLSHLGYQVALVPVGSKLPDGSYVLEPSRKEPAHEA